MDDDEPLRRQTEAAAALAKESLEDLSVFELKERIDLLRTEIARAEQAIAVKETGQSEADKLFN